MLVSTKFTIKSDTQNFNYHQLKSQASRKRKVAFIDVMIRSMTLFMPGSASKGGARDIRTGHFAVGCGNWRGNLYPWVRRGRWD